MLTLNLVSAAVLEKAVNRLIAMDLEARKKLSELSGKQVSIHLSDWNMTYVFCISDDKIHIVTQTEEHIAVTMSGTSFAFFNMALSEKGGDALFKGEVHFQGEVSTAQKFQNFWQSLEVDWEEELSKYTGDIVAHQVGQFARQAHEGIQKLFQTAQQNFSEYVKEESRVTPTPFEVETFYDELDDLKSDVNRLESRIVRLKNNIEKQN